MDENLVAIYCRLSKEDENSENSESESIQNQKSMLLSFAHQNNFSVYNIYSDEDYSGSDNDRPQWNKMLEDAENGKFNIIICKTQSRFSRNMEIIEKYVHGLFLEWGIRFISIVDNADTEVKGNKKSRQINSLINEWFLEDLSENIKSVFTDKMKKGEFLASFAPYGYKKDPDKRGHLIIDENTSENVKRIFDLSNEGYGAARIARMLNDDNIPNPRKQQEIYGLRKTKMYKDDEFGIWSTTSIGDILHNQVYCGDTIQGMFSKLNYKSKKIVKNPREKWIIVKNTHEPIIDRDLFEKIQISLSMKRKSTGMGKPHLLAQKVFCFHCGKPMQKTHTSSTKHEHIDYLRCRDKYYYSEALKCDTPNVRIDAILAAIKDNINALFSDQTAYKEKISQNQNNVLKAKLAKTVTNLNNKINELERKVLKLQEAIKSLYLDKTSGIITDEQFSDFNVDFRRQISESEREISELTARITDIKKQESFGKNIEISLQKFLTTQSFDREIIDNLINKIMFGEYDEALGEYKLRIIYNWE